MGRGRETGVSLGGITQTEGFEKTRCCIAVGFVRRPAGRTKSDLAD